MSIWRPDRRCRAFELGTRLSERAADGIGLGLPLANRVVELHGGELDIVNRPGEMSAVIRLSAWQAAVPVHG